MSHCRNCFTVIKPQLRIAVKGKTKKPEKATWLCTTFKHSSGEEVYLCHHQNRTPCLEQHLEMISLCLKLLFKDRLLVKKHNDTVLIVGSEYCT